MTFQKTVFVDSISNISNFVLILFCFEDSLYNFLTFIIFVILGKFLEKFGDLLMILDVLDLFLLEHNWFEVLFAESEINLSHRGFLMHR